MSVDAPRCPSVSIDVIGGWIQRIHVNTVRSDAEYGHIMVTPYQMQESPFIKKHSSILVDGHTLPTFEEINTFMFAGQGT